jgi:hypothetical protein
VQPAVELVGGEEAAFVEQCPHGGQVGGGEVLMDPKEFTEKQFELAAEFAQYVADHPEVDELLPEKSHVYFEIDGHPEFNAYSRAVAERRRHEGVPIVLVRIKGLAPQVSRLIEPVIEQAPALS